MRGKARFCGLFWALVIVVVSSGALWAQVGAVAGAGGAATISGVYVDAEGVLHTVVAGDERRLRELRRRAAMATPSSAVAAKSQLRKVSLTRLARSARERIGAGQPVGDDMRYLAGMQQIQYLFVYPEAGDLVIAGPAEGWVVNRAGRVLGKTTRRPVLQLDDLVVALRLFPPGDAAPPLVGCSINHTPEGIRRLNQFMASLGRSIHPAGVNRNLLRGVQSALGLQTVSLFGVPANCRLAMVLIEADYRMKLIGLGLEKPRVRGIVSYTSQIRPSTRSMKQSHRWWFVPEYSAIIEAADGNAFELEGPRAKLLAADDRVLSSGQIQRRNTADRPNRRFVFAFSKHFEKLAGAKPIFAELQNAFDLLIIAALVQQRELQTAAHPDFGFLYEPQGYQPEAVVTPRQVLSAVNYRRIGNRVALPVGGGVRFVASEVLARYTPRKREQLDDQRRQAQVTAPERWWWD